MPSVVSRPDQELLQVDLRAFLHPWAQHRLRNNSRVQVVPDRSKGKLRGVITEVQVIGRRHRADLMRKLAEGEGQLEDEDFRPR